MMFFLINLTGDLQLNKLSGNSHCIVLLLLTPIYFWLSHYFAVFPHEYAHALVASLTGFKEHFWQIDYGGTSFWNIAFLTNIDQHVNYAAMYRANKAWLVGLTAFAGMGFGNGFTYLISLWLMSQKQVQSRIYFFYFCFWWHINSIGNFIDYVPIRTFTTHGDMADLANGLHISPWWIMAILGYLLLWILWYFYSHTLIKAYTVLNMRHSLMQFIILGSVTCILFGFYGSAGLKHYGDLSHFLSLLSVWMILPILVSCWPNRMWVQKQLKDLSFAY